MREAKERRTKGLKTATWTNYFSVNQLPHVWGPNIIILNSNKTTTWCGSKRGSGWRSAPLRLKRSAPCSPGRFSLAHKNPPGCYTDGIEEGVGPPPRADCDRSWVNMEGAQTNMGEGVGPPLRVCCDRIPMCSWASLRPPTNLYVHLRSTKCRAYGGKSLKSVTRGALHPHSQFLLKIHYWLQRGSARSN